VTVSPRGLAEIYLKSAVEVGEQGVVRGDRHAQLAIAHLLLSIDDHLERLAEGLTHGPARTHDPLALFKNTERYNPREEGE
jgi:hypothetical protein